ncbi:hypothetical protein [Chelatococcus asaccharovorans]|uniref:hypothetical protein n=1 Tax=Chelatococcus asaccharovorans TaxID=28210 RepID=UPI00224C73EE|nr:hypothetical protein [Chelatococcus asaccharovorans]CAH1670630.1 conserved membrane hypothetical protein [Chelatococcus asaccharovorans]CAH1677950.1 conserved membrane hypothetical protein [Chelatococcus asaccharovorans]
MSGWLPVVTVLLAVVGTGLVYGRAASWPWRLAQSLVGAVIGIGVVMLALEAPLGPWLSPVVALALSAVVVGLSFYLKARGPK